MNLLRHLRLKSKILSSFGIGILLSLLIGGSGLYVMRTWKGYFEVMVGSMFIPSTLVSKAMILNERIRSVARDAIRWDDADMTNDKIETRKTMQNELLDMMTSYSEKKKDAKSRELYDEFQRLGRTYFAGIEQVEALALENKDAEAYSLLDQDLAVVTNEFRESLQKFIDQIDDDSRALESLIGKAFIQSLVGMSLVIFLGAALMIWLGLYLARSIAAPTAQLTRIAQRIAEGDVNQEVTFRSDDEIGQLANAFRALVQYIREAAQVLEQIGGGDLTADVRPVSEKDTLRNALSKLLRNLNEVMTSVLGSVQIVTANSTEVSQSSMALSQGATEQASSLEEINSSMTQISAQTKNNAENASQANVISSNARDAADQGKQQIETTVAAMSEINHASQQISKIIKVIDDIAFQTNLLALNAAVEAARAGKHGKGFAVVADEVRNLAGRSAKAAKQTAEMIESSGKSVENGLSVAQKTAQAFQQIAGAIVKSADLVAEISAASNEQAQGVAQVSVGLNQIGQVTQQNTALAEQTAAASMELVARSEDVQKLLARFKLRESQKSAPVGRALPAPYVELPAPTTPSQD